MDWWWVLLWVWLGGVLAVEFILGVLDDGSDSPFAQILMAATWPAWIVLVVAALLADVFRRDRSDSGEGY